MGYNTTVLVLNDALTEIENDPNFGKKLAEVIRQHGILQGMVPKQRVSSYVRAGSYMNAATVIETHHSSQTALVAIGGNYGSKIHLQLGARHHLKEDHWDLLENALEAAAKP
jgi:hypothetical protein